ncbi:hypothetical protein KP509_36G004800 [Ceratopteris richardii]|uniref:Uncharacterized protein n=1 Tax=Ceratopteris richardii TaxID=49495 RepID=A0A8T2QAQ4_CERRI|nr:hypothetical protein KP509_36G004800 [Ceratopteris richardii]
MSPHMMISVSNLSVPQPTISSAHRFSLSDVLLRRSQQNHSSGDLLCGSHSLSLSFSLKSLHKRCFPPMKKFRMTTDDMTTNRTIPSPTLHIQHDENSNRAAGDRCRPACKEIDSIETTILSLNPFSLFV